MKKIICILLAMMMFLSLFGCSGKTASDGEAADEPSPKIEAPAPWINQGLKPLFPRLRKWTLRNI